EGYRILPRRSRDRHRRERPGTAHFGAVDKLVRHAIVRVSIGDMRISRGIDRQGPGGEERGRRKDVLERPRRAGWGSTCVSQVVRPGEVVEVKDMDRAIDRRDGDLGRLTSEPRRVEGARDETARRIRDVPELSVRSVV